MADKHTHEDEVQEVDPLVARVLELDEANNAQDATETNGDDPLDEVVYRYNPAPGYVGGAIMGVPSRDLTRRDLLRAAERGITEDVLDRRTYMYERVAAGTQSRRRRKNAAEKGE